MSKKKNHTAYEPEQEDIIEEEVCEEEATAEVVEESAPEEIEHIAVEVKAVEKPKKLVYVGPTIYGVAVNGTTYSNGISKEFEAEIEKQPILKSFLVELDKVSKAISDIKTEGSALNILYKKIKTK